MSFGHAHKPWHRIVDDVHFVNTRSVGRPKDGDPRTGNLLLDVTAFAEFLRTDGKRTTPTESASPTTVK
ncbi:MAG: metallophosphatase family protein [Gemmatimonadota bacterium]|nr:metallophosphatase family protein [Gemmatimonadota bacterium]